MSQSNRQTQDFVVVGRIVGPFGLQGGLKVEVLTDFYEERFSKGSVLYVRQEPYEVLSYFWHKTQLRLTLAGVDTLEAAESLRGEYLEVPFKDRPTLEKDEYYVQDLLGLTVVDQHGEALGSVQEIISKPAHSLIKVDDLLIPAVSEFVKKIDLEERIIVVHLIPGMREAE